MQKVKVGLLGLTSTSINKGCEALTYSFLEILKQYDEYIFDIYFIERFNFSEFKSGNLFKRIKKEKNKFYKFGIKIAHIFYRNFWNKVFFTKYICNLDICFDFTQGDSFTDIYGDERFNDWTMVKEAIILNNIPLILGSQTVGPFHKELNEERAKKVIEQCQKVFVRDIDSFDYVKQISNKMPILTTDVAFFLPYNSTGYKRSNRIGFNPSGLLWNGGYTSDNQFDLAFDYKKYCEKCISYAIRNGFEVHLIGHVITEDIGIVDNDYVAIADLHKMFPETIVAPIFDTPMEAKTYISKMSAFTGARMHATIAAISSGVPVMPFSYSRKFEGLFSTLKYNHIIHGREESIGVAVSKFQQFIDNIETVEQDVLKSQEIIEKMKCDMLQAYRKSFDH